MKIQVEVDLSSADHEVLSFILLGPGKKLSQTAIAEIVNNIWRAVVDDAVNAYNIMVGNAGVPAVPPPKI